MRFDLSNVETPCFFFDAVSLTKELESLQSAISRYWSNTLVGYSVKTNSLPFLASFLFKRGVSAEVVSEDEYEMVKTCGYTSDHIICNGPIKHKSLLTELLNERVITNLDSHAEVDEVISIAQNNPMKKYDVGIRVNIDIEKVFSNESNAGIGGSRFGFNVESGDFGIIVNKLQSVPNLKISGLHLHINTKTRRVEIYQWLVVLFDRLVKEFHLEDISYLDLGGGFYGGIPNKPSWNDYLQGISEKLCSLGYSSNQLLLILEPGVSLLASSLQYFTRIVDYKITNYGNFVICDGSRIHVDPLFHKESYFYKRINNFSICPRNLVKCQTIVGFTCLENDRLFSIENEPELQVGDILQFDKVGAYTTTFSPLFISYFPAIYTISDNGEQVCVREKWTAKEFIQKSQL